MKKTIFITIFCILISATAFASPFLVCDPQSEVVYYDVQNLGVLTSSYVPAQADGSIRYDLQTLPVGTYTVSVRACNQQECSDPATLTFTRSTKPGNPRNLRVIR